MRTILLVQPLFASKNRKHMKKAVIKYGLISGAISASMMLIVSLTLKNIGFDKGEILGYASMVLSFLVIYPGMIACRKQQPGEQISYLKALWVGLLITMISSVCYVITWVIAYHTIFPDFIDKYGAYMIDKLKQKGTPAAEINKRIAEMQQYKEMYKNPVIMCLLTFIEPLPVGIVISLVSAFIVRTKKKSNQ